MPPGLSLASGTANQSVGDLAVGQERQVPWSVIADFQTAQATLIYSVTATASNALSKTIIRQILLPVIQKQLVIDYFALGDSIASGHGLEDDGEPCHKSYNSSYPHTVYTDLLKRYAIVNYPEENFVACSGATVMTSKIRIQQDDYSWFSNQVDYVLKHLSNQPTLVTITISMDDYGWTDQTFVAHLILESTKKEEDDLTRISKLVEPRLINQVDRLLKHQNVVVVFTDYPNPVNTDSVFFHALTPGCLPFLACYDHTETFVHHINRSLILNVVPALNKKYPNRVRVASIHEKFHENHSSPGDASLSDTKPPWKTCGFAEPPGFDETWIQYPGELGVNSPEPDWLSSGTGEKYGDCFHPNYLGAIAIGDIVDSAASTLGR